MPYKGIWGFSTLALTESTTGAHLYVVNRSGNKTSQDGAVKWIDKSIEVVKNTFDNVYLRGDSDFSLTGEFDRWTEDGTKFIFVVGEYHENRDCLQFKIRRNQTYSH